MDKNEIIALLKRDDCPFSRQMWTSSSSMDGNCSLYCSWTGNLRTFLEENGCEVTPSTTSKAAFATHQYFVHDNAGEEMIIDPTIRQFIREHPTPFVGTRKEVKELFFEASNSYEEFDKQRMFMQRWGDASAPVEQRGRGGASFLR
jgi:hypothetical protein